VFVGDDWCDGFDGCCEVGDYVYGFWVVD